MEKAVVELVYKFDDEKSYRECLKGYVSRLLKYVSKKNFGPQTLYVYTYMDTNSNHFTPLVLRVRGKNNF